MPARFRPFVHPFLPAIVALAALPGLAAAVDFGRLELRSALGQPLRAEIGLTPQTGETLVAGCIRVAAAGPRELPTLDEATLELRPAATGKRLLIASARPLSEPAALLVLEVDCGDGRRLHELPVLPKPAAVAPGDWLVSAGESPDSLARTLFPGEGGAQRRFVAALARANPGIGINPADPGRTLPAGTRLRWPDWRALTGDAGRAGAGDDAAAAARAVRGNVAGGEAAAPAGGRLQLSGELSVAPVVDEATREILRREYRLLDMLQRAMSGGLPAAGTAAAGGEGMAMPAAGKAAGGATAATSVAVAVASDPAPAPATAATAAVAAASTAPTAPTSSAATNLPAAALPTASAPPAVSAPPTAAAVPPAAAQPDPAPPAAATEDTESSALLLAGGAAAALLLLLLFVRRRRAAAMAEREAFQNAQTIVLERPLPGFAAAAPPVGASAPLPAPLSTPPSAPAPAPAIPEPPAESDANPVMELAEIMLSFGRLQGAAQALQEYIEANPKEALQPWMKLLDIYREGGMRSEFDTLAGKLHGNFNVEVQQWDGRPPPLPVDSVPRVMALEELPHICERITASWGTPECLDYLHQLLRDNRGGERIGFTLPVVQEILLLIEILTNRENAA